MSTQSSLPDNESEARLRQLIDNLPRSYLYQYTFGPDGKPRFNYISAGVWAIHGLTPEQIMADSSRLEAQTDPAFAGKLARLQKQSQDNLSDFKMEIRIRRDDGDWRWLELRSRPRQDASGQIIWDGVSTDITEAHEQKQLLKQLARRTEVLLGLPLLEIGLDEPALMQEALDLISKLTDSPAGFIHFIADTAADSQLVALHGLELSKKIRHSSGLDDVFNPAHPWGKAILERGPVLANDFRLSSGKTAKTRLNRLISVPVMEGSHIRMLISVGGKCTDYQETDLETLELIGNEIWHTITRRRDEKALRIASQVVNASPVVCFRWRAEANWPVEFVSDNITQWGYSPQDILAGKPSFSEMVHPDDLPRVIEEVTGYTANGLTTFLQEYRLLTADGQVIWVEDRTLIRRGPYKHILFYDGILTDITERKQRQETMDKTLSMQRQLNKRLEEAHNQLLQSEKMASIGQLAAGVAHELNNPIGFVHSNLGTLDTYLHGLIDIVDAYESWGTGVADDHPARMKIEDLKKTRDFQYIRDDIFDLLEESKEGLNRVRKIVLDLKSFSHVGEQEWQLADLHQGLDSTLNIVWNELKYKCTIIKEYGELPPVYCLISQLNQVFMNLLVNAGQAIEQQGTISLRTRCLEDDLVQIEICDTGKGIPPAELNRIFEPFFTTKPVGTGTGLGLSLSYSIIQRHHGRIEVDSTPGQGSCFRVIIPITQNNAPPRKNNNTETAA